MIKKTSLIYILFACCLTSCNFINLRNYSNDFKWEHQKLKQPLEYKLVFNPDVKRTYVSPDFFYGNHADVLPKEGILIKKLRLRNYVLDEKNPRREIIIDKVDLIESVRSVEVTTTKDCKRVSYGYHDEHSMEIIIVGRYINLKTDMVKDFKTSISLTNSPRCGFLINSFITYKHAHLNMNKVWENLINKLSYKIYKCEK